ncbi:MAG: AAA family ATPase [Candidatus Pacebacteria bacterium]|nr:AAA family ATPase [Candidatus Paceibacterota bacterium]
MVSRGIELQRLLLPPGEDTSGAAKALLQFINTPVTMKGNFRRLREHARETLLMPIVVNNQLSTAAAQILADEITTGKPGDQVFFDVRGAQSDKQLEARHREQLDRYLFTSKQLLDDFLFEQHGALDPRLKQLQCEIAKLENKLRHGGIIGSIQWFESQISDMLRGVTPNPIEPTLMGTAEALSRRAWETSGQGEDEAIDLPEFHFECAPSSTIVVASILRWRYIGRVPTRREIVEQLLINQQYSAALRYANEIADPSLVRIIESAVAPAVIELNMRCDTLIARFGRSFFEACGTFSSFEAALSILALSEAAERLELIELELEEDVIARAVEEEKRGSPPMRERLQMLLRDAWVSAVSDRSTLEELQQSWDTAFEDRSGERQHLLVTEIAMAEVADNLPELNKALSQFSERSLYARHWLLASISESFADLVKEALERMKSWAASAHLFLPEEREALSSLGAWFMDFVTAQAETLQPSKDSTSVEEALELVLSVCVTILGAERPTTSLSLLRKNEARPVEVHLNTLPHSEGGASAFLPLMVEPSTIERSSSNSDMPEQLKLAIREERWEDAAAICNADSDNASQALTERLLSFRNVFVGCMDRSPKPPAATVDCLITAAAWLANDAEAIRLLTEARRIDLAFGVFTGVLAADAEVEIARSPGPGGSWASLFGKGAPLRRFFTGGLPARSARALESLISGSIAGLIAQRLWDAVTTASDPQTMRTPLLQFMHDHGGREAILRLAGQHDSAIAPRLEQLFETRAAAASRPDLVFVAQALADQISSSAKTAPFRDFVKTLPIAAEFVRPSLEVTIDEGLRLRNERQDSDGIDVTVVVRPVGLVPAKLEATLFADDDVTFADNSKRRDLASTPLYFACDFSIKLRFGMSWYGSGSSSFRDAVRLRVTALTVTGERFSADVSCSVKSVGRSKIGRPTLDTDTLLELYPGVNNTPAIDSSFVGRFEELERLNQVLVSAKRPSPVLLTGMRRIGKTSLLFAFHKRFKQLHSSEAITFYISLAERKVALENLDTSVSRTIFDAIRHGLVRQNLNLSDQNHKLCTAVRAHFVGDWKQARSAIQACYDEESLADSLISVSRLLIEWTKTTKARRVIFLVDEAEALVAPYLAGGRKRLELEQFLQSLREISQNVDTIGFLLCGSNHINVFTREYKNAFFGSSQVLQLEGLKNPDMAANIVCPAGIAPFIQFERSAVSSALDLCAGMPQFLWQIGATTSHIVRSGTATRSDVRNAVAMLIGEGKSNLPFKSYEVLEPIESMLQLHTSRERDLLWMLLFRVAASSSLVAPEAAALTILDPTLMSFDDKAGWTKRLLALVELRILSVRASFYSFTVPLFAEGFRAQKNWQEFDIRHQRVGAHP